MVLLEYFVVADGSILVEICDVEPVKMEVVLWFLLCVVVFCVGDTSFVRRRTEAEFVSES